MTPDSAIKATIPLIVFLTEHWGYNVLSCLLSSCEQKNQWWQKIPGVVGGKVTLNLYHANSKPDLDASHPHISFQTGNPLHRPPALAGGALNCMRLTSWCLESAPESLPSCQSKFPWKFCSRPQDNVSPVDDFQRYTRKWKRGCLKEDEFCNWEKEIGEINVSVYPLYFCLLWAPFAYSNYLK